MYSLFGGANDIAQTVINEFPTRRIEAQIEPDGSQPHELRRTIAYWYSVYNLAHILDVCDLAEATGVRIYNDRVKAAIDFLTPYIGKEQEWPYPQIHDWEGAERLMIQCLYRADKYSPESGYMELYRRAAATDGVFTLTF